MDSVFLYILPHYHNHWSCSNRYSHVGHSFGCMMKFSGSKFTCLYWGERTKEKTHVYDHLVNGRKRKCNLISTIGSCCKSLFLPMDKLVVVKEYGSQWCPIFLLFVSNNNLLNIPVASVVQSSDQGINSFQSLSSLLSVHLPYLG